MPVWRGVLVTPAEAEWIVQSCAADPTSGSLRKVESEGHACRAREIAMDNPALCTGREKRVPARASCLGESRSSPI